MVWKAKPIANGVELTYLSKDGEAGYPGNLTAIVRYTLMKGDLRIEYSATTDKDTVINLTNHSYFNLAGQGDILNHQLTLHASRFTPVDAGLIPTGELKSVESTPFDFRKATAVGARIGADDEQLHLGHGYDHNWVLDSGGGKLAEAAELYDPKQWARAESSDRSAGNSVLQRQLSGRHRSRAKAGNLMSCTRHCVWRRSTFPTPRIIRISLPPS